MTPCSLAFSAATNVASFESSCDRLASIRSSPLPSASAAERREAGDVGSLPKDSNTCHAVEITVKIVSITLSAPSDALKKPATDETPSPMWSMMSARVPLSTTWPI